MLKKRASIGFDTVRAIGLALRVDQYEFAPN